MSRQMEDYMYDRSAGCGGYSEYEDDPFMLRSATNFGLGVVDYGLGVGVSAANLGLGGANLGLGVVQAGYDGIASLPVASGDACGCGAPLPCGCGLLPSVPTMPLKRIFTILFAVLMVIVLAFLITIVVLIVQRCGSKKKNRSGCGRCC